MWTTWRFTCCPNGKGFQLFRDGRPYYIKGIGGSDDLETAARLGANSVRTWAAQNIDSVLERAARCGMSVLAGIWLSHDPAAYLSDAYKERKTREVLERVEAHKDHPALLMWALGNEVNLEGADTPAAWQFIDQLVLHIRRADPHHPVISVIAWKPETLDHIAAWAPHLDAVGINAYGALPSVRTLLQKTAYEGPYLVTEWGVRGTGSRIAPPGDVPSSPPAPPRPSWCDGTTRITSFATKTAALAPMSFCGGRNRNGLPPGTAC